MYKKLTFLLLFISVTYSSQKFLYPYVGQRPNKSYSIKQIEIQKDKIKVDLEYYGSFIAESISIPSDMELTSGLGIKSKLIKAENVAVYPKNTRVESGKLLDFSLYFSKINLGEKSFSIASKSPRILDPTFLHIELPKKNNTEGQQFNQLPKADFFMQYIEPEISHIYFLELFASSQTDSREIFNNLIEKTTEKELDYIKNITTEQLDLHGKSATAYTVVSKVIENRVSSYYYSNDEDGKRINSIMIYFENVNEANLFLKSIADWYGASGEKNFYILVDPFKGKVVFFNLNERHGIYTIDINVLTWDEYMNLRKSYRTDSKTENASEKCAGQYFRVSEIKVYDRDDKFIRNDEIQSNSFICLMEKEIRFKKADGMTVYRNIGSKTYMPKRNGSLYQSLWGQFFIHDDFSQFEFFDEQAKVEHKFKYIISK